jgi:hypothetical protein
MPIFEEGSTNKLYQQDEGSALQFVSSWIESSKDVDQQTQPYHLATLGRLNVYHLISSSGGTQLTEISIRTRIKNVEFSTSFAQTAKKNMRRPD